MLPGIHGLDVCRIIKSDQKTKNIPVIMLTAMGQEGYCERTRNWWR